MRGKPIARDSCPAGDHHGESSWVDLASRRFARFDRRMTAAVNKLVRRYAYLAAPGAARRTCVVGPIPRITPTYGDFSQ